MDKELSHQAKIDQLRTERQKLINTIKDMEVCINQISFNQLTEDEKRHAERLTQDSKDTISRFEKHTQDLTKEIRREMGKRYYAQNTEKVKELVKKNYMANPEKAIEDRRKYREANREKMNKHKRENYWNKNNKY